MITTQAIRKIDRYGVDAGPEFKIKATGKAFRILSDGLYSDKILAIVRELSCNAWDAHVAAGKKDVPFEIHLPNDIEPWFSVKDFGTGLSHEEVQTLYTTYFDSTKDTSNDYIGTLGLGSKSPFSYVDQFIVKSRHNGIERTYSAFISENDVPRCPQMGDDKVTTEPNGLEIIIAVKRDDFERFADKVRKVLFRFNPQPIVKGYPNFTFPKQNVWVSGANWTLHKDRYHNGAHAIQGNVAYPIDIYAMQNGDEGVPHKQNNRGLSDEQAYLLRLPLDIEFNIGDLEVAASREKLSYDDRTIANINKRLNEILEDMPKKFEREFSNLPTLWEANKKWAEMFSSNSNLSYSFMELVKSLVKSDKFNLCWNGTKLKGFFKVDLENINFRIYKYMKRRRTWRSVNLKNEEGRYYNFHASNNIRFYYDDMNRGCNNRILGMLENQDHNSDDYFDHLYVLKPLNKDQHLTHKDAIINAFKAMVGNAPVELVSNIPLQPRVNSRAGRKLTQVWRMINDRSYHARDNWEPTNVDIETGSGIYVQINRFEVMTSDGRQINRTKNLISQLVKAGITELDGAEVYGITSRYMKKVEENENWVNLFDLARKRLTELLEQNNYNRRLADAAEFNSFTQFRIPESVLNVLTSNSYASDSTFKAFIDAYSYMSTQQNETLIDLKSTAMRLGVAMVDVEPTYRLDDLWKKVLKAYPMIALADRYQFRNFPDTIIEYVNLVDGNN